MPKLPNKKLISGDFEQKFFAHFLQRFADFRAIFVCSKSAEMKSKNNYLNWELSPNFTDRGRTSKLSLYPYFR